MGNNVSQNVDLRAGLDAEVISTAPRYSIEDQTIAWQEMNRWFLQNLRPETGPGQAYWSAYRRSDEVQQAALRRIGYQKDWPEFSAQAYEILEHML